MRFIKRGELTTTVEIDRIEENQILNHFLRYGDEVIYVTDKEQLAGIVTPGDLKRFRFGKIDSYINKRFSYLKNEDDEEQALEIFEKLKIIHEIPVINNGVFKGVLKSGRKKNVNEWRNIRESFFIDWNLFNKEHDEWIKADIIKLLSRGNRFFVYEVLSVDDMNLSAEEQILFDEKMNLGLSSDIGIELLTQSEQREIWGEDVDEDFLDEYKYFISHSVITYNNGIPRRKDERLENFGISNGKRLIPNVISGAKKRILVVGSSTIFGAVNKNNETIPYYLQKKLYENNIYDYEVVNMGLINDLAWIQLFDEQVSKDDVIILMTYNYKYWKEMEKDYPQQIECNCGMKSIWSDCEYPIDQVFDAVYHCGKKVNKKIADVFYSDINKVLDADTVVAKREIIQNYYISWDIYEYYRKYYARYAWEKGSAPEVIGGKCKENYGCIVMNGNPFTKGHRYLIEQAASKMEYVYVLVLETDKSYFNFLERLNMARSGTKDLKNVKVIPSGRYVISEKTFSQYFDKEHVEEVLDMSYDLHIFGRVVAPLLGITKRFVGEEPNDIVTKKYNETMKRVLPQYGIGVEEIPRIRYEKNEFISASTVRNSIHKGDKNWINLVPSSTKKIIEKCCGI